MWVLEPGIDELHWFDLINKQRGSLPLAGRMSLQDVPKLAQSRAALAYVLAHGGNVITQPLTPLNERTLSQLETCLAFSPGLNGLTYLLALEGLPSFPDRKQLILCQTAFFTDLPQTSAAYGLPYDLFSSGVRRYGGDGFFHAWAWQKVSRVAAHLSRLVSVHLGNTPNTAAILNGKAVETSFGFSASESIPSQFGSGEVDPTIPLMLRQQGWDADSIAFLLTRQAGIQALAGKNGSVIDLLEDETQVLVRQAIQAHLLKSIGRCLAARGGADCIVFAAEEVSRWQPLIDQLRASLSFAQVGAIELLETSEFDFYTLGIM